MTDFHNSPSIKQLCSGLRNAECFGTIDTFFLCLQNFLAEEQSSVGTRVEITHDAPTPVGMKVWAEAEITASQLRKVGFTVR